MHAGDNPLTVGNVVLRLSVQGSKCGNDTYALTFSLVVVQLTAHSFVVAQLIAHLSTAMNRLTTNLFVAIDCAFLYGR